MLLDMGFPEGGTINDLGISVETTHNRGFTAEELAIKPRPSGLKLLG
mgnify:CR=1 FL=1